jgi:SAM-dependent methyltransferase
MPLDVNDLLAFYASPLGAVSRRLIGRVLSARWERCAGLSLLGLGYGGPYLERFRDEAQRLLAFMPAEQGVVNWPVSGRSASALVEPDMLPLPDASIDRVLVVHGLETAEHPSAVLEEIWRILTPGGRLIVVAPSRRGVWARVDGTPFGQGQPYSKGQLRDLMREALFSPLFWGEALYAPPFRRRFFVNSAPAIERLGTAIGLPFAGVHIVEATKQVYRPVGVRRVARRESLAMQPGLAPVARRETGGVLRLSRTANRALCAPSLPAEV